MKVWMIWVEGDGLRWLEAAWDDDATAENNAGWVAEVERIRRMCGDNAGYSFRIMEVHVPGVSEAFAIPRVDAVSS